jgi:hypothetical protein
MLEGVRRDDRRGECARRVDRRDDNVVDRDEFA